MCEKCNMLAELIEQTRDGDSWVEFAFPNGTPRLITREDNAK